MSAGWKKNSMPGKRLGSSRRSTVTNRSVGSWPSFSDSRISPSSVPMVPALLYERLMPELGTPRLSSTVSSWSAGTSSRIAASTWSAARAVSSMRVPVGMRMCRRSWPESTAGKKSRPRMGYRPQDSTQNAMKPMAKLRRCESSTDSARV